MRFPVHRVWSGAVLGIMAACSGDSGDQRVEFEVVVPQDRYAEVNGIRVHYLDWGGEGDLLLLVPGLGHTAHTYDAIAPAFTDRFRVVSVTRREHGSSDKPGGPIDLETLVDDLDAFLGLYPDRSVVLAGQSYAGLELPRLAKRHPGRVLALIFLDAVYDWTGWVEPGPPFPGFYVEASSYASYEELFAWFEGLYPEMWHSATRAHLVSQTYLSPDGTVRWHLPPEDSRRAQFTDVGRGWTPAEYEGLDLPILSIQVEQGGFMAGNIERVGAAVEVIDTARTWANDLDNVLKRLGREALAAAAPHAVMVQYADTHHWLQLQSPERVVRSITDFLDQELGR